MEIFTLPHTTIVNRVIPKNAFDAYATAKQRKLFTDLVQRITWTNKLSPETVRLESRDIKEIQVFKVELKTKTEIAPLLDIVNKAIPYNIIFIVEYNTHVYLSTSAIHPHPINENNAVVDWTFKSDWFSIVDNNYSLNLKKSLDSVYLDFCIQLSDSLHLSDQSLRSLVEQSKIINELKKEVARLKSAISNCSQFNQKVELNMKLKEVESYLNVNLNGDFVIRSN